MNGCGRLNRRLLRNSLHVIRLFFFYIVDRFSLAQDNFFGLLVVAFRISGFPPEFVTRDLSIIASMRETYPECPQMTTHCAF